jgi:hypothetical protein
MKFFFHVIDLARGIQQLGYMAYLTFSVTAPGGAVSIHKALTSNDQRPMYYVCSTWGWFNLLGISVSKLLSKIRHVNKHFLRNFLDSGVHLFGDIYFYISSHHKIAPSDKEWVPLNSISI